MTVSNSSTSGSNPMQPQISSSATSQNVNKSRQQNQLGVFGSTGIPGTSGTASSSNACSANTSQINQQQQNPSYLFSTSSTVFQQVKQTQASLARLSRVHQLHQQQIQSHNNANSQTNKQQVSVGASGQQVVNNKSTTFVDCLIGRFKNCFSEDFCTVPMFVVGNLSPGSDGTHLILPPCVSLSRQNISRCSSPKNVRLMNSIRESCRSVEELDLGSNKLTDLIEVYKILQCTPNLKFLNLSENDLSRSLPVAMAPSSATSSTHHGIGGSINSGSGQRAYLAPINQNQQAIGARRHSTLGHTHLGHPQQPSTSTATSTSLMAARQKAGPPASRVAEARRLATAASALAQSKKTSSCLANKITNSAASSAGRSLVARSHAPSASRSGMVVSNGSRQFDGHSQRRSGLNGATSTMQLARSLSSLSAKDIRGSNSSLSRLSSHHRSVARKDINSLKSLANQRGSGSSSSSTCQVRDSQGLVKSESQHGRLFPEPIDESDVDMVAACNDQTATVVAVQPSSSSLDQSQQQQSNANNQPKVLSSQTTGSNSNNNNNRPTNNTTTSFGSNSNNYHTNSQVCYPSFRRTFESVKALALNNTGCPWRVVCSILSRMPELEELHLSLNNYERIDLDPNEFRHHSLKRLYLCNNPKLTNWQELDKLLIAFPSLEALSIADCNISQIPDNLDSAREWRKLCGLNINGWPIKEWPIIERLNQLPSLIDLKCRNLEILNTIDEPRHHLIARLPKLQRLNGSEIEEREHAEKAFLRFFMANSHLERPTRFHELIQIHGDVVPEVDVDVDLSPPSQAQVRVIYLNRNFYRKENDDILMSEDFLTKLMDASSNPSSSQSLTDTTTVVQQQQDVEHQQQNSLDGDLVAIDDDATKPTRLFKDESQEVLALNVDLRQSVRKFKMTLADLFGLDTQNLILYYIDHEMVGLLGPELIKHNQKKLWNYNIQNGDQFIVEER